MQVDVQDVGLVDFPDDATDQEIQDALNELFPGQQPSTELPAALEQKPIQTGMQTIEGLNIPQTALPYNVPPSIIPDIDWQRAQQMEAEPWSAGFQEGVPTSAGITPAIVPQGTTMTEAITGIPKEAADVFRQEVPALRALDVPMTLASSVAKTGIGLTDYLSSPQGVTELVLSMTPAKVLVLAKWAKDMAGGAYAEGAALGKLLAKENKAPEDYQQISDHTINALALGIGAGFTGKKAVTQGISDVKTIANKLNMPEGKIKLEDRGPVAQEIFNRFVTERQVQAGSPFVRAEAPAETISMGVRTQPPLSMEFDPQGRLIGETFEPSGLRLTVPPEIEAGKSFAPSVSTVAPLRAELPVRAVSEKRLSTDEARRLIFETAVPTVTRQGAKLSSIVPVSEIESLSAGLADAQSLLAPGELGVSIRKIQFPNRSIDRGLTIPKALGDLFNRESILDQAGENLDINQARLVMPMMLRAIEKPEVFNSVIKLIPIDMVDMLSSEKFPSEKILHDPAMFVEALASNPNPLVPIRFLGYLNGLHLLDKTIQSKPSQVYAIYKATKEILRDVRQPEIPQEGQVQVPVSEGRPQTAEALGRSANPIVQQVDSLKDRFTSLINNPELSYEQLEALRLDAERISAQEGPAHHKTYAENFLNKLEDFLDGIASGNKKQMVESGKLVKELSAKSPFAERQPSKPPIQPSPPIGPFSSVQIGEGPWWQIIDARGQVVRSGMNRNESARALKEMQSAEARVESTLESDKALYQDITSRMTQLIRSGQATSPLMEVLKGELEVVKNRHGGMPPGQTSPARQTMQAQQAAMRVELANEIHPAVRIGGRVISDPNKGHIQMALEVGGPEAISEVSKPANQGFVYKGEFISREATSELLGEKTPMTSERLKEIRAEQPKGGEPIEEAQRQKEVLEPEPEIEAVTPLDIQSGSPLSATESLINRLEALKFPEKGEGRLYSLPHPDAVKAIGRTAWNDAIDIAIAAVKSGKAVAEAVESALAHILKNAAGKFDEAKARANLEFVTRAEAGAQRPPPIGGQPSKITEPTATEPNFTATDPITGEPAKLITEKAARAMERKVKIPAQADVETLTKQIDLFNNEIGDALETGGQFLPKDLRPEVSKGAPAEKGTVTNKQINQYFVNKLSSLRKQMEATRRKIDQQADVESQVYFDALQKRFETAFRQVQELRRASHEALYFWNKIRAEYQEIARAAGAMPEMKRQLPILDQIWKDMREKNYPQAGKHFVDYLRMNLFTLGSWTLDFGTNLIATGARIPAWAIMDVGSLISGRPPTRMFTAMHALADNMKNWNPFGKRFRLPDKIETELGTTAGGEFPGRGKEVIIDFSEILRSRPELANRLKEIDRVIGAPVRMKRAVDSFFGRFGATAELYNRAYIEGKSRGLKGDELKQFVEEFIQTPPESALNRAIQTGKELKFNRDLTKLEEAFARNWITKVVLEAFPRWSLQFTRWGGEMLGVDPSFFKKAVTGKATPEEIVTYLTKAATGWGGIYAFNQLFYDNIDANSMEYVTEEGDRIRLSGRTPAPELFFIVALLRGDNQNAQAALSHISVPGAKFISGETAGLIGPLVDTIRESIRGRYTAEMTARELTKLVNDTIPGKSVLGLIRSIFDPTIREGIGAPIPGIASLLPQKPSPTTGEPLAPRQRIPGTSIEIPTVGGTPFPGAVRVLNDVEAALMNHGFGLTRPRRTSIIDLPAEDVPKEMRREYEKFVGQNIKTFIGEEIKLKEFQELPFDVRREILSQLMSQARQLARADMAQKYGTSMQPVESVPLNIQRMPKRLRQ